MLGVVESQGGLPTGTTTEATEQADTLVSSIKGVAAAVLSLLAIFGRIRARGPLTG